MTTPKAARPRLSDEQVVRIAALLRPHLPVIREAQQHRSTA